VSQREEWREPSVRRTPGVCPGGWQPQDEYMLQEVMQSQQRSWGDDSKPGKLYESPK